MSVSILAVDDELDVADLFRQHFRREAGDDRHAVVSYNGPGPQKWPRR